MTYRTPFCKKKSAQVILRDCFSEQIDKESTEVRAVLKKMKRHKAPGLLGLVAEMIQTTGDIGTQ